MALSGLQIYKLLPQTNCKECGFPTCLAFSMKLAQKAAELAACPYVSDEAKAALDAAATPPIRLITIGSGERAFSVGNEVVLFRHEKTFFHEPGLVVRVPSDDSHLVDLTARWVSSYAIQRVGMTLRLNGLAIEDEGGGKLRFQAAVAAARAAAPGLPLVLLSGDPEAIAAGLEEASAEHPLIGTATAKTWQAMAELAAGSGCPLLVRGADGNLEQLADLAEKVRGAGADIVLDPGAADPAATLSVFTQIRRLALKKGVRSLGFPLLACSGDGSPAEQAAVATAAIAKYAGVVVLDSIDPALLYALMTLRLNVYTDPQKPIQMEPKLYSVGTPNGASPLFVTTNFSLTYFTVSGEIESSGVPVWLLVADADGMSVLTAWAAGKFDAEKIAKTVNASGVAGRLDHRRLVLPGFVAGLSGEVEDELPGWEILVGPRDSAEIPSYLKNVWAAD
jgi:acetyl-CoA decarbonylase/synthase complex subunit gamma